jgi:hypothetical protein
MVNEVGEAELEIWTLGLVSGLLSHGYWFLLRSLIELSSTNHEVESAVSR